MGKYRKIIGVLLVAAWMVLIFCFSNQPADQSSEISGSVSDRIVTGVKEVLHTDWDRSEVLDYAEWIETPVRKAAHMTEYAILAVLVFHMLTALWEMRMPFTKRWYLSSIAAAALYASTDEFHQLFIPGRSGEFKDVCIDTTGAAIGMLLLWIVLRLIHKGHNLRR